MQRVVKSGCTVMQAASSLAYIIITSPSNGQCVVAGYGVCKTVSAGFEKDGGRGFVEPQGAIDAVEGSVIQGASNSSRVASNRFGRALPHSCFHAPF